MTNYHQDGKGSKKPVIIVLKTFHPCRSHEFMFWMFLVAFPWRDLRQKKCFETRLRIALTSEKCNTVQRIVWCPLTEKEPCKSHRHKLIHVLAHAFSLQVSFKQSTCDCLFLISALSSWRSISLVLVESFLVTFASSLENSKKRVASLLFKCCLINGFKLQAPLLLRYQLSFPLARPDDQMKQIAAVRPQSLQSERNTRRDNGEIMRIIALLMDCNRYSASRDFCYNLRLNLQWGATRLANMLCKHLSSAPKRDGSLYDPWRLS